MNGNALIVGACLWALLLWFQHRYILPEKRAIVGCRHRQGTVKECAADITGRPWCLVWFCKDCPFQTPLRMLRGPKLEDGRNTWVIDQLRQGK